MPAISPGTTCEEIENFRLADSDGRSAKQIAMQCQLVQL